MKKRNVVALILIVLGLILAAYYLGFAHASDEGLSIGFSMMGMYGSLAISFIGVLILVVGIILSKK